MSTAFLRSVRKLGVQLGTMLALLASLGSAPVSHAATPYASIAPSGISSGISGLFLGNDLSAQITTVADGNSGEVYPDEGRPGDYGTFAVVDGVLYAPDFGNHPAGSATGSIGSRTVFTPVAQSAVGGTGTVADPFKVVTQAQAGATGIQINQTDTLVAGNDYFRTDIELVNSGSAPTQVLLYRALDCYLGSSDNGYGSATGGSVSCTKNPNNSPAGRIETLTPLTGGSHFRQDGYSKIWQWIGTKQPFDDACAQCANQVDNGMGISWAVTIPAGGSVILSHLTLFSPLGTLPLVASKTTSVATVPAGGQTRYTIKIANPNPTAAVISSIVDTLPAGFSYVAGSSSGATTSDPTVSGQSLTWGTPLTVPANGSITVTFDAKIGAGVSAGTYFNRVQGTATEGNTVQESGDTAPVTVTTGVPPETATAIPTLSEWGLVGLALLLAAFGLRRILQRR